MLLPITALYDVKHDVGTRGVLVAAGSLAGFPSFNRLYLVETLCLIEECMRCNSDDYRGKISITDNSLTCQHWDSQTPHKHDYTPSAHLNKHLEEKEQRLNKMEHNNSSVYVLDTQRSLWKKTTAGTWVESPGLGGSPPNHPSDGTTALYLSA
ncbi:plasminogen-like [Betta splendens]|uniref:Plasminogen-like n=1 Tax=Betta splendens TaxID=158456 RepID=A0A9W2XL45_BETSP|nr:plasminogen-like [Betta splendens]